MLAELLHSVGLCASTGPTWARSGSVLNSGGQAPPWPDRAVKGVDRLRPQIDEAAWSPGGWCDREGPAARHLGTLPAALRVHRTRGACAWTVSTGTAGDRRQGGRSGQSAKRRTGRAFAQLAAHVSHWRCSGSVSAPRPSPRRSRVCGAARSGRSKHLHRRLFRRLGSRPRASTARHRFRPSTALRVGRRRGAGPDTRPSLPYLWLPDWLPRQRCGPALEDRIAGQHGCAARDSNPEPAD